MLEIAGKSCTLLEGYDAFGSRSPLPSSYISSPPSSSTPSASFLYLLTEDEAFLVTTASGVTMDRYDGRQLLSAYQLAHERSALQVALSDSIDEDNADEVLNLERYKDLEGKEEDHVGGYQSISDLSTCQPEEKDNQDSKVGCTGNVVKHASNMERNWYRYPDRKDVTDNESHVNEIDESFSLPSQLPSCPEDMIVPRNQKIFDLIMHTAKKTRTHHQLEILIKVKQGDNINFDFLQDDHSLHPFYRFIKSLSDEVFWSVLLGREVEKTCTENAKQVTERVMTSALSILGDAYISDSEEDGEEEGSIPTNTHENGSYDDKVSPQNILNEGINDDDDDDDDVDTEEAVKVQRLMRAKKLKRYFLEKIQFTKGEDNRREASVEEVNIMGRANYQEANSQEESEVECSTAATNITNDNDSSERSKRKATDVKSNTNTKNTKKGTKLYIEGNVIRRGVAKNMLKYLDHYVAKTDPN